MKIKMKYERSDDLYKEWRQKESQLPFSVFDEIEDQLGAINGIEDVYEFLHPQARHLHDPYLLNNMDIATIKIIQAINKNKKIVIHFDIDADGCFSGAIMFNYLRNFTDNVSYIHAQRTDGHGISNSLEDIPKDTDLLIIVDSSTSEKDACKQISEMGIDIVIIDHHPQDKDNPYATIVNPQIDDYPNKELSGSALCWKVCGALDEQFSTNYAQDYVDMAGFGLIADVMCMKNMENRYIVYQALSNVKNVGLLALFKRLNKTPPHINSTDIGFSIGPMINATSRMNQIELAIDLLTNDDPEKCKDLAKKIEKLNEERKQLQSSHVNRLSALVNPNDNLIILVDNDLDKGFAGLVAMGLVSQYKRPALILHEEGDTYTGSYRSVNGFNLKEFFNSLEIVETGGHAEAGGCTVAKDKFEQFKLLALEKIKNEKFEQVIEYDLKLSANEINEELIMRVQKFSRVCGKNIPEPKFLVTDIHIEDKEMIGKKVQDTVKVKCGNFDMMKFKTDKAFYDSIPIWDTISAVGTLNINSFYHGGLKQVVKTNQLFILHVGRIPPTSTSGG